MFRGAIFKTFGFVIGKIKDILPNWWTLQINDYKALHPMGEELLEKKSAKNIGYVRIYCIFVWFQLHGFKYNGENVLYDANGNMTYGSLDGEMVTFRNCLEISWTI